MLLASDVGGVIACVSLISVVLDFCASVESVFE